ncbi:OprD family outer membrane porin [Sulfuricurvum sp.]|uniref:OprD family outer membrane porin n=1 Tax=Sulfuricurvum sp. TaxID=2025608 RepID=UPI003BAF517F
MKLVKMSLAAAVLLGASAFAIDNVKVSGDAKLFYSTNDATTTNAVTGNTDDSLFSKGTSAADTALRISVTGDLTKGVSFGATGYAVSTLGLENNLVDATWTGAHGARTGTGAGYAEVDDKAWMGEMWVAATLGKTTAKLGRMELDTPLAFSEKWSIVPNTFDAAVLINQDIPDTTLVGAWVGKGNGTNAVSLVGLGTNNVSTLASVGLALDGGVVGADASFTTFNNGGAYAAAIVNNSFKPLVAQAWYYNVANIADAYWLQADWDCQLVKNVKVGAQYADMSPKGALEALGVTKDSKAYAFKLAYSGVESLNVSAAYSNVDKDGTLNIANVATSNLTTAQSKLYTETYWSYGVVGAPDAESINLTAEYDMKNVAKFGAYYTNTDFDVVNLTMNEVAITATKSFGPLDATVAYINTDWNTTPSVNTVQAYLTLNF